MIEAVEAEVFQRRMQRRRDSGGRRYNLGDWKPVGGGVAEMRIDHGPGYRVYFARRGDLLIIILAGGTKSSQSKVIARAIEMAGQLE